MDNPLATINSAKVLQEDRLRALKDLVSSDSSLCNFPKTLRGANIMLKTIFSFSPYTPSMAAFRAKKEGLAIAGVSDTNSVAALQEMRAACAILKIASVSSTDFFINLAHTRFFERVINTPYTTGIIRSHLLAFPLSDYPTVRDFLIPIGQSRHERNKKMVVRLNEFLSSAHIFEENPISYEDDILPLTMAGFGGFATQRHILAAIAKRLAEFSRRDIANVVRNSLKISISAESEAQILDEKNPHFLFDLVEILFGGLLNRFFVQPDDWECVSMDTANEFVRSTHGIFCYFYHGGDDFEDSYLEELFPYLREWGFSAVSFVPSMVSARQFSRLSALCQKYEMMPVIGADIYNSRTPFSSAIMQKKELSFLHDSAWALLAHETFSFANKDFGLFSPTDPISLMTLPDRVKNYAEIGRQLSPCGILPASEGMKKIFQIQQDFIATLKAKATADE